MSNDQIIKSFQKIYEQQQRNFLNSRQSCQMINTAKIHFTNPYKKNDSKQHLNLFDSTQDIQPWSGVKYNNEQDIKGIYRLNQSSKRMKRCSFSITSATKTSKSWTKQKQKHLFLKQRQPIHLATPVFQPQYPSQSSQRKLLCFLRRKNEQSQQKSKGIEPNKLFEKHKKLLSRIYSHSCDGKLIIRDISKHVVRHDVNPICRKISSSPQYIHTKQLQKQIEKQPKKLYSTSLNFKRVKIFQQVPQYQQTNTNDLVPQPPPNRKANSFTSLNSQRKRRQLLKII